MTPVQRQPDAVAVGYIRRSVEKRRAEDTDGGAGQRAAIARLAERNGETIATIYAGDWGISGQREKREKRADMAAILAGVRAGTVSAIYAFAVDRLARDDAYALTIRDACEDAGVLIHTDLDGTFDMSNDRDRDYWGRKVTDAASQGRRYTAVNRDTKRTSQVHIDTCPKVGRPHNGACDSRCIPGEHCAYKHDLGGPPLYGTLPGEDVIAVGNAYHAAGSALGAAQLLTAAGVPSRRGKPWSVHAVLVIVRRVYPDIAPAHLAQAGRSPSRTRLFTGLLTCHCGTGMTSFPRPGRKNKNGTIGPASISYFCRAGHLDPRHPARYMVAETKVKAWAQAAYPGDAIKATRKPAARVRDSIEDIAERRAKVYALADVLPADVTRAKLAALDKLQAKVAEVQRAGWTFARALNWNRPPAEVNRDLRNVWHTIHLGPDMLPVRADWIIDPDDWDPAPDGGDQRQPGEPA